MTIREFDHNDGTPIFELEFMANGNEYEYDIHAGYRQVVKAEHKTASTQSGTPATGSGSTNYNDTDYGPITMASPTITTQTTAPTTMRHRL